MYDTNEVKQEMLEQSIDHSQTRANKKHDEEIAPQTYLRQNEPAFPPEEQRRVRKLVGVKVGQCLLLSPFVVLIV
jgi:hypothetical protein